MIAVGPGKGAQRLDRWLRGVIPDLTQAAIERMCRKGEIRIDGSRVRPSTRVDVGQTVRIPPLARKSSDPAPTVERLSITDNDSEMIRSFVLYRDDHLIVLNKPSGLASQGGSGLGDRHVDRLTEALTFGLSERPRLVHRLDKDTSGLLVLARSQRVARSLSEALRHRKVRKLYWAVVAGVPRSPRGTIRYGLVKAGVQGNEKMQCVHPEEIDMTAGAKRAVTDYAVIDTVGNRMAWLAMVPLTGRTHQLRAHIAQIGHPIIGDSKYGSSRQENAGDGWGAGAGPEIDRRLHLHARTLTIEHPITNRIMTFTAPLPPHMKRTWEYFGWKDGPEALDPFARKP